MRAKWTAEQAELEQGGDTLLDIEGAAHMLGTTVRHLRRLRSENRIPYVKLVGLAVYPDSVPTRPVRMSVTTRASLLWPFRYRPLWFRLDVHEMTQSLKFLGKVKNGQK